MAISGSPFCFLESEKIAGFASSYRIVYDDDPRVYSIKVGAGEACDLLILIV
jgi:hypothetical protein